MPVAGRDELAELSVHVAEVRAGDNDDPDVRAEQPLHHARERTGVFLAIGDGRAVPIEHQRPEAVL